MEFRVLPVLDLMLELYAQPRTPERFQQYLKLLQGGTKNDMELPLQFFNPMAKAPIRERLLQLKGLDAEGIMQDAISRNEHRWKELSGGTFRITLNLADDIHGGWTSRYSTDYDSRFRLSALVKRQLSIALFWAGENQNEALIRSTTIAACLRTVYWLKHGAPQTLAAHLSQEQFALSACQKAAPDADLTGVRTFYELNKASGDAQVIFNFLYGDAAAASLGNAPLGIRESFGGLRLAAQGTGS